MFVLGISATPKVIDVGSLARVALANANMTPKELASCIYDSAKPDEARMSRALSGDAPLDLRRLACGAPLRFWIEFLPLLSAAVIRRYLEESVPPAVPIKAELRDSRKERSA